MKLFFYFFCVFLGIASLPAQVDEPDAWAMALPGWEYNFPQDHYHHPDFRTEWWYFVGHLHSPDGRAFGFQVTFFRNGIIPPALHQQTTSQFLVGDVSFAHFAISDLDEKKFLFDEILERGAFGEVGFGSQAGERIVWLRDWQLELLVDDPPTFQVLARQENADLQLVLSSQKPMVFHGSDGVSQKSPGAGEATHYYSLTRLQAEGELVYQGQNFTVTGSAWLDREWGSNQLGPDQVGWDWFSLQLSDGSELMIYQLRNRDGSASVSSSGTFVFPDGSTQALRSQDFQLIPGRTWRSPNTQGNYPINWTIEVPGLDMQINTTAAFPEQELVLPVANYWEGSVGVSGQRGSSEVTGRGYMELTGYAGELRSLQNRATRE